MSANPRLEQFVGGYVCPSCNAERIGIERYAGDHLLGWSFRVPEDHVKKIHCASCGADVPKSNWQFRDAAYDVERTGRRPVLDPPVD